MLLPNGLGRDARFAVVGLDAVGDHFLERGAALVFHHIERVGKFAVFHRRTRLEQAFQRRKKLAGAFNGIGRAVELDPAFARGGLHAQLGFNGFEIARFVIEKLLRKAGVFVMQGFGGHR